MLTRGGIEFLAVLLGISLSLYIDQQAENRSVAKTEMALLSDLQVSLNQDISYIDKVLNDLKVSFKAQERLISFPCDQVDNLSEEELADLFRNVLRGSTSLFPRYGVYRSLVSNSEMKYIDNHDLKYKLIDLYDFQFKRYEKIDPIITNLYQYGLSKFLVEEFGYYRNQDFEINEEHLVINKEAFCDGALKKEIMKISTMTAAVNKMLEMILESMSIVSSLIGEEIIN